MEGRGWGDAGWQAPVGQQGTGSIGGKCWSKGGKRHARRLRQQAAPSLQYENPPAGSTAGTAPPGPPGTLAAPPQRPHGATWKLPAVRRRGRTPQGYFAPSVPSTWREWRRAAGWQQAMQRAAAGGGESGLGVVGRSRPGGACQGEQPCRPAGKAEHAQHAAGRQAGHHEAGLACAVWARCHSLDTAPPCGTWPAKGGSCRCAAAATCCSSA